MWADRIQSAKDTLQLQLDVLGQNYGLSKDVCALEFKPSKKVPLKFKGFMILQHGFFCQGMGVIEKKGGFHPKALMT